MTDRQQFQALEDEATGGRPAAKRRDGHAPWHPGSSAPAAGGLLGGGVFGRELGARGAKVRIKAAAPAAVSPGRFGVLRVFVLRAHPEGVASAEVGVELLLGCGGVVAWLLVV